MANFIPLDTSKRLGAKLRNAIDQLILARDQLADLKATMIQCVSGVDYSVLETQFGITAGQGQAAYNLVSGTSADIAASINATNLTSYMG